MKRVFDVFVAIVVLMLAAPILMPVMLLIYLQDWCNPFYVANRVGRSEKLFKMIKLRSMVKNADKSGVDSTSAKDPRITQVGHFVRRTKFDELPQLFNVLMGQMSLVGPRPNVKRETDLYSIEEKKLLSVRPGITDLSSIVFSDENDILKDSADPDLDYNQRIRPWKSRLGILYVQHRSLMLDFKLLVLTAMALIDRKKALDGVNKILLELGAEKKVVEVAKRSGALEAAAPPGMMGIVMGRG